MGRWYIELCEREVVVGRNVDRLLFRRPTAHPFLVMINDDGDVVGELHGVPHDRSNDKTRSRLARVFEFSAIATTPVGLDLVVRAMANATGYGKHYPVLRSRFYDHVRQYPRALVRHSVFGGTKDEALQKWSGVMETARRVDAMDLSYNRYGWGRDRYNCQTMMAIVLAENGMHHQPTRYAMKGWKLTEQQPADGLSARYTGPAFP